MNDTPETDEPKIEELDLLKKRADQLGLKYHPSIGVDALRKKVDEAINGVAEPEPAVEVPAAAEAVVELTPAQKRAKLRNEIRQEALKLVRCRISNMNPLKKELDGEIFTVANKYIGDVKKFIPYGEKSDGGYHIPYCLYEDLKNRKFLSVRTKPSRIPGRPDEVIQRWVSEFNIEVLPPLTKEELAELARAQAAKGGLDVD